MKHLTSLNMNFKTTLLLALVLFPGTSCSPGNKTSQSEKKKGEGFLILATRQLGESFTVDFNRSGNLLLCKSQNMSDPSVPHYTVRFLVYDLQREEIIYEGSIARGEVAWHEDRVLRVSEIPGIVIPDEEIVSHTWLYDIDTGKKKTLGSSQKF